MSEWKTRITKVQVLKPAKETGEACLVLIYPPGPDMGKRFALTRNEIVLGRGADCDIQVDRDSVSRRHARVFRSGESWSVEDLQSTNGSYVNGQTYDLALTADYTTGQWDAYINGAPAISGSDQFWNSGVATPVTSRPMREAS